MTSRSSRSTSRRCRRRWGTGRAAPGGRGGPGAAPLAAGLLGEPLATLAEDRGQIVRLSDDFVDGVQVTALYYSGQFMREHPKEAVGFMAAWLRASRDLYGGGYKRDDVAAIVEKYTNRPGAVGKRAAGPLHDTN